jgi:hypothetical protein
MVRSLVDAGHSLVYRPGPNLTDAEKVGDFPPMATLNSYVLVPQIAFARRVPVLN